MGIEYYSFALFLTGLICLIAIICKLLFSNVKKQYNLLDEKEAKLLQLYQTVESIMEDFNDQVNITMAEIREYRSCTNPAVNHTADLVVSVQGDSGQIFKQVFDEATVEPSITAQAVPVKQTRNEAVFTLVEEGKTEVQIASELGITQNEVRLIIGLAVR
jgi:hypothetical protein